MMKAINIRRFATILFLSLMVLPLLCQSCSGQAENKRTADSLFADSLRPKTKLKPLVQPKKPPMVSTLDENSDKVFVNGELMPSFPGGDPALLKFLHNNLRMPIEAAEADIQCKIIISFFIEKDGNPTGFKVVKSSLIDNNGSSPSYGSKLLKLCEKEALRGLKLMPKWIPGMIEGKPARIKLSVPVTFDGSVRQPPSKFK